MVQRAGNTAYSPGAVPRHRTQQPGWAGTQTVDCPSGSRPTRNHSIARTIASMEGAESSIPVKDHSDTFIASAVFRPQQAHSIRGSSAPSPSEARAPPSREVLASLERPVFEPVCPISACSQAQKWPPQFMGPDRYSAIAKPSSHQAISLVPPCASVPQCVMSQRQNSFQDPAPNATRRSAPVTSFVLPTTAPQNGAQAPLGSTCGQPSPQPRFVASSSMRIPSRNCAMCDTPFTVNCVESEERLCAECVACVF